MTKVPCFGILVSSFVVLFVPGFGIARGGEAATASPVGQPLSPTVVYLEGDQRLLATDRKNGGREAQNFDRRWRCLE